MKKNIYLLGLYLSIFFINNTNAQTKITKATTPKMSVSELLQGKWQSTDDKTNYLVFEKNQRKEISGGMKSWDSEAFTLSNKCLNESDKGLVGQPTKDFYISCLESDLCWNIMGIDKNVLTLSYTATGRTLEYRRVKK
jgi:hypothetical protein